jgi:hypothetical protein
MKDLLAKLSYSQIKQVLEKYPKLDLFICLTGVDSNICTAAVEIDLNNWIFINGGSLYYVYEAAGSLFICDKQQWETKGLQHVKNMVKPKGIEDLELE